MQLTFPPTRYTEEDKSSYLLLILVPAILPYFLSPSLDVSPSTSLSQSPLPLFLNHDLDHMSLLSLSFSPPPPPPPLPSSFLPPNRNHTSKDTHMYFLVLCVWSESPVVVFSDDEGTLPSHSSISTQHSSIHSLIKHHSSKYIATS